MKRMLAVLVLAAVAAVPFAAVSSAQSQNIVQVAASGIGAIATRLLDLGAPALCLFGGLGEPLRPWLAPPLRHAIVDPASDAMDGAILLARRHAPRT